MIIPTKKRLTLIFTTIILVFNIVILVISYLFLHQSIVSGAKLRMTETIRSVFLDQYRRSGLDPINSIWDEHFFQILNKEGGIVVSSRNAVTFLPDLDGELLRGAYEGKERFGFQEVGGENYLVAYFPIDGKFVGRAALSLTEARKYEKNFLDLVFLTLPGMVLLSYLVSRYLVSRAMERISEFFTFQETFSSNVTHELRSPLASLKGNLEVTLRKERTMEEYQETLKLSLKEVDRMIGLLSNLFLLASSKFKPLDLFRNETDIVKIVDNVAKTYAPKMAARAIRFTHTTMAATATCLCDETLIRTTIENVIDNAVKYTPDKGSISLSVEKDRKNISVSVTNTCKSMDKGEMKHIFDPFYRGRNVRTSNIEGKGLGLYISRYIIRSHGGEIKVNNTHGNLFSLTITVPVR